ncbi:hypothetical protein AB0M38_09505 [Streptomyces sp. NPDC051742]|uniref:hypothetical protein n=1 Tax=unclassified Streptomyces TaxID=2593676 RepID=UPI003447EBD2
MGDGAMVARGFADARRTAVGALLVLALISGCGTQGGSGGSDGGRVAADAPSRSAEQNPPVEVRRDRDPVLRRFPQLGNITGVEWASAPLGSGSSRVPGPTDFRFSGVATLAKADVRRLQTEYDWVPGQTPPSVLEAIAPEVPAGTSWQMSEGFTSAVTGDVYTATFLLDPATGVMVFDAVNPNVVDGA